MSKEYPAVILAAGRGRRLEEMSLEKPKPMVHVNSNETLIERLIKQLVANNIRHVVIVVGYLAEKIIDHLEKYTDRIKITFVNNDIFDRTNNIYSLWLAREYLHQGFYLFEADICCEDKLLEKLLKSNNPNLMLIDKYSEKMNGTVVSLHEDNKIDCMYLKKHQDESFVYSNMFKTVNYYRIGGMLSGGFFLPKLEAHITSGNTDFYYELIIREALQSGFAFYGIKADNHRWWEIDTAEDLLTAKNIFSENRPDC